MLSSSNSNDITYTMAEKVENIYNFSGALEFAGEVLNVSLGETNESFGSESGNFTAPVDFWSVFDSNNLRHSLGWTIAFIISYTLVFIVGIVGNLMVILVVWLRPNMRSVTNMFIVNLAIADLFVNVFCVPGTLLSNVLIPWILDSFMCKGVAYVQGVSVCASAYSLVAISIDRYKAINQPLKRGLSERQASITICLIWIASVLLILPWAFIFDVTKSEKDGQEYCIETWNKDIHGKLYYLFANIICCYLIPLIVISITSILISSYVTKREIPQNMAMIETVERIHRKTRHGVKKMLSTVTFLFLLSWLPLYIFASRMKFSPEGSIGETENNILSIVVPIAQWLGISNSSVNPILYAFLNSKFREGFRSILPSWMPFSRRTSTPLARSKIMFRTRPEPQYTMSVFTVRKSVRNRESENCRDQPTHQGQRIVLHGSNEQIVEVEARN